MHKPEVQALDRSCIDHTEQACQVPLDLFDALQMAQQLEIPMIGPTVASSRRKLTKDILKISDRFRCGGSKFW